MRGISYESQTVHAPALANPEKLAQLQAVQRWFRDYWNRIEPETSYLHRRGVSLFLSLFDDNTKVKWIFCPKKGCYDPQKNVGNQFGKPLPSFCWLLDQGSVAALNFPIGMNPGLAKASIATNRSLEIDADLGEDGLTYCSTRLKTLVGNS